MTLTLHQLTNFGGCYIEALEYSISIAPVPILQELCKYYSCGVGELVDVITKKRNLLSYDELFDGSEEDV